MVTDREQPIAAIDDRSYLYPHAWPPPVAWPPHPGVNPAWPRGHLHVPDTDSGSVGAPQADHHGQVVERAVIGDALRIPLVWCQFGSCIARFTDAAALGESDVRRRAVAAGWRQDAFGRLACPECVQHDPTFMVVHQLVTYPSRTQSTHRA